MKTHAFIVTFTISGWLVFVFAIPAVIAGFFFVMGTAEPWGMAVPVMVASFGWLLTRLDFREIRWRTTVGWLMVSWAVMSILISLLILSRTDSLSLAIWSMPPAYCFGMAGILLMLLEPRKQAAGTEPLPVK